VRGVPFIYYGEEIGMGHHEIPLHEGLDPIAARFRFMPQLGRSRAHQGSASCSTATSPVLNFGSAPRRLPLVRRPGALLWSNLRCETRPAEDEIELAPREGVVVLSPEALGVE
jgi:hypothetical protein